MMIYELTDQVNLFDLPCKAMLLSAPGLASRLHRLVDSVWKNERTFHVPRPTMGISAPVLSFTVVAIAPKDE